MKQLIIYLFAIIFGLNAKSQDFVSTDLVSSVFNIKYGNSTATGFLLSHNKELYLITAKHIFPNVSDSQKINIELFADSQWVNIPVSVLLHNNKSVDIAILKTNDTASFSFIDLSSITFMLGDEGFFLGFPFGLHSSDNFRLNKGFPVPLIKKAIFSGSVTSNGVITFILDGNNNPGFSGAPVLFKNRSKTGDQKMYLLGVISAYFPQTNKMRTPFGDIDYTENSGLIIVVGKVHIEEIFKIHGK